VSTENRIADALAHHEAGRLDAAAAIYRDLLLIDPDHLDALHLLGLARLAQGAPGEAAKLIARAVALAPDLVPLQASLGDALMAAGQDAARAYERVVAGDPTNAAAAINLANIRLKQRRHAEAIALAERAVGIAPSLVTAHAALGAAHFGAGRADLSLIALDRALVLDPAYDAARAIKARALTALGRDGEAETEYLTLIAGDRNAADRHVNYGVHLLARVENEAAAKAFEAALALDPDHPEALNGLGLVLKAARRNAEAAALFRRAIEIRPGYADALNNLGHLLAEQNELDAGIRHLKRAVASDPDNMTAWGNLVQAYDMREPTVEKRFRSVRHELNALLATRGPMRRSWNVRRDSDKRLRVRYISTDFHGNSAGLLALPVITHHGRDAVEVYCYADSRLDDSYTARFRARADVWRPIAGLSDGAVVNLIVADGIDVLVDLSGYTSPRFAALATKPAPVQLSGWGFGHGMGLDAYDGLLLDGFIVPEAFEADYPDPIVRLPIWLCYEPPPYAPEPGPLPARARGYPVFGCFNRIAKMQPVSYEAFARVLAANPTARLRFKDGSVADPATQALVRANIASHGGDATRVEFIGKTSHHEHLAAIADVDVMLNPFPYGGGMSAVESLWMGVPLVARIGRRQQERGAPAFLALLGLDRFITEGDEAYARAATEAVQDLDRLAKTRAELRGLMQASLLCDPIRYVAAVEEAYSALWRRWCATGSAR